MRRPDDLHAPIGKNDAARGRGRLPEANVCGVWLTRTFTSERRRRRTMTSEPAYQALFLGAGPQMQCGVGQFTRLLQETIEKLDPGSSTTLTLTRSEGSVAEIWRAVGSARSVVCNFPIVAWKRVMFRPLLALAMARLRRRRDRPDPARMGRPALAAPHHLHSGAAARRYHRDVLAAGAAGTRRRSRGRLDRAKMRAGAAAAEYRSPRRDRRLANCGSGWPPRGRPDGW